MDWRSITFDWNRARAFLVTAEEGSLAAAARAMGMNQPTLGRQVAALEEEIGFKLFTRRGRGLELTPNGVKLLEHVRLMGDAANQFLQALQRIAAIFFLGTVLLRLDDDHAFFTDARVLQF